MSPRLVIAAQSGVVIGLVGLTLYQARQLREAHRQIEGASLPGPELPVSTNGRPVRLRLQQLPPIHIRNQTVELDWRTVESEDYAEYIANLRRIKCPEETIRDIIRADVDKLFAARRRAIAPVGADWDFWRSPGEPGAGRETSEAAEREREQAVAGLERERRQLLTTLLGAPVLLAELDELRADAAQERSLQFLAPEKREAVAEALARYRQAIEEGKTIADPADRETFLSTAERTLDEAFNQNLTPAEREQYEMRSSPLADEVRERLRGFSASRDEFETLFRIEREYASQREAAAGRAEADPHSAESLEALDAEQDAKVREALGEKRFADFQRARDPDFQTLYSLALDHSVPTQVANQVWDMRTAVQTQTDRIRANPLLTQDQKIRALDAVRSATQSAIVDVLGEPLLHAYQRTGSDWLTELTAPIDLGESGLPIVAPPLPPGVVVPDGGQALALPPQ